MRTRWQFYFECEGIHFDRVHEFEAKVLEKDAAFFSLPPVAFDAIIRIEPDKESYSPVAEQTGRLHVILPGNNEQTKNFAFWMAHNAAQQITFSQGRMKISYGLIMGELLADTPTEAEQLGDNRFFAEAHLVEVKPPPAFNGDKLQKVISSPLIQQFNAANSASNPIDRFLGLFRILEDLYGPAKKKANLAKALKASDELFRIAQGQIYITQGDSRVKPEQEDFFRLVDKFVKTRHECAHLRSKRDFGITHGDPRVRKDVEPLANMMRALAFEAIKLRA
jgi:hypothetical protein